MVLGFFVDTFLDITLYTGLWVIKKTGSSIYYIFYGNEEDDTKKIEISEEIKNLQKEIKELKELIEK